MPPIHPKDILYAQFTGYGPKSSVVEKCNSSVQFDKLPLHMKIGYYSVVMHVISYQHKKQIIISGTITYYCPYSSVHLRVKTCIAYLYITRLSVCELLRRLPRK